MECFLYWDEWEEGLLERWRWSFRLESRLVRRISGCGIRLRGLRLLGR